MIAAVAEDGIHILQKKIQAEANDGKCGRGKDDIKRQGGVRTEVFLNEVGNDRLGQNKRNRSRNDAESKSWRCHQKQTIIFFWTAVKGYLFRTVSSWKPVSGSCSRIYRISVKEKRTSSTVVLTRQPSSRWPPQT